MRKNLLASLAFAVATLVAAPAWAMLDCPVGGVIRFGSGEVLIAQKQCETRMRGATSLPDRATWTAAACSMAHGLAPTEMGRCTRYDGLWPTKGKSNPTSSATTPGKAPATRPKICSCN